ncbi:hypothetical protein [Streptomyces tanashiensis]|uniref:hypothetical protein n=1 Tax=Streptomyces tanashiensis TaxID=67367 RepID=UPI00167DFC9F|nr:hypothetical protein [Streptomyces tanashiensis]GGY21732.1 hypothetical protein GCM10010299_29740 [Streptomyces tanashiensis]
MESFTREADMLDPIVSGRQKFTSLRTRWESFYEVQTSQGVVDLIFAVFLPTHVNEREIWGVHPIQERSALDALTALSQKVSEPQGFLTMSTVEIADRVRISPSHLRKKVLPHLVDLGWVERSGKSYWRARHLHKCPTSSIYAIEVKRSEWQRALMQATSHTRFANKTYVAMDASRIPRSPESFEGAMRFTGIGMISVSADDQHPPVSVVIEARKKSPSSVDRLLVAERLLAIRSSGGNAGEISHVFGQWVTTSSGPDPRRSMV